MALVWQGARPTRPTLDTLQRVLKALGVRLAVAAQVINCQPNRARHQNSGHPMPDHMLCLSGAMDPL
ncbi:MAG: hypothetical protein WCO82_09870 [Sphingomonadales bacterium]|jgi:hypothetical protein